MLRKLLTYCSLCCFFINAYSQDTTKTAASPKPVPSTTLIYSLDAYYRYDLHNAPGFNNNLTSFTNSQNSFELGMASIRADHSFGKIAATLDLGFGRRAEEFSYNDGQTTLKSGFVTLALIKQAYISYAPSSKIKFTAGKWATHIGYELLDAYSNRNYSMSYGFSYGPFFHTGFRTDITLGAKSALMIGIANPTDFSTTTSSSKVFIAQYSTGTKNDKLKAFLNYQGGKDLSQFDLVLNGVITSKFGINYDGTIATRKISGVKNSWSSNAIYLNYDPQASYGFALRGEYFNDKKNVAGVGSSVYETTLSMNVHIGNLTLIPEIRYDNAKDAIFAKDAVVKTKNDVSVIMAAVYKF